MHNASTTITRHSWLYFVLFVAAGSYDIITLPTHPFKNSLATLHWQFSPGVSVAAADCINTVKQRWRCDNYGLGLSECYVNHGTASTSRHGTPDPHLPQFTSSVFSVVVVPISVHLRALQLSSDYHYHFDIVLWVLLTFTLLFYNFENIIDNIWWKQIVWFRAGELETMIMIICGTLC